MYSVTKTYGHERGLSCAFRQWRAKSHCSTIHGYALAFTLVFEADRLDECGWVIDFGSLGEIKQELERLFDHTLAVAEDDPHFELLKNINDKFMVDIRVFREGVGCERFAQYVWKLVDDWLSHTGQNKRVRIASVECREHAGNAATYTMRRPII